VSNVQLDDNIRIWLLEEKGYKSAPETFENAGAETTRFNGSLAGLEAEDALSQTVAYYKRQPLKPLSYPWEKPISRHGARY